MANPGFEDRDKTVTFLKKSFPAVDFRFRCLKKCPPQLLRMPSVSARMVGEYAARRVPVDVLAGLTCMEVSKVASARILLEGVRFLLPLVVMDL